MRSTSLKTFIWISLLLSAALVIFVVASFVSRTMSFDAEIPSLLETKAPWTEPDDYVRCESVVFAVSANGDVYSGKRVIGTLANTLELTTRLKQEIDAQPAGPPFSPGLDLNVELPGRCTDKRVYLKTARDANQGRILQLFTALHDSGIDPVWVIDKKKRT